MVVESEGKQWGSPRLGYRVIFDTSLHEPLGSGLEIYVPPVGG